MFQTRKTRTSLAAIAAVTGATFAMLVPASAEPMKVQGKIGDVFGHRAVVETANGKVLVNFGPKSQELKMLKPSAEVTVDGDMKKSGEIHARTVKLGADEIILAKDKQTWREWLLGDDDDKPFTEAEARRIATEKGYKVSGDLSADKRHFTGTATDKDGKTVEVDIHGNGDVKARSPFTATDARTAAEKAGYQIVGELAPEKKHFTGQAKKGEATYIIHVHRDEVKEISKL